MRRFRGPTAVEGQSFPSRNRAAVRTHPEARMNTCATEVVCRRTNNCLSRGICSRLCEWLTEALAGSLSFLSMRRFRGPTAVEGQSFPSRSRAAVRTHPEARMNTRATEEMCRRTNNCLSRGICSRLCKWLTEALAGSSSFLSMRRLRAPTAVEGQTFLDHNRADVRKYPEARMNTHVTEEVCRYTNKHLRRGVDS